MLKQLFSFFFLFFLVSTSWAQQNTLVVGKIVDSKSNEELPFVNVVFVGTQTGTITGIDGTFRLQTSKAVRQIEVSYVGFKTRIINILPRQKNNLKIKLKEESSVLSEVELVSKRRKKAKSDSPAIIVMKNVWRNKKKNIAKNIDTLTYDQYEKTQMDINNFSEDFKKNRLFKRLQFIFEYADTSDFNEKSQLPLMINEAKYKVLHSRNPNEHHKIFLGNKISGFQDNRSAQRVLESLNTNFDIYKPAINVFEKSFTSPLASIGQLNYHYYLKDSTVLTDGNVEYTIQYIPKRSHELTFMGEIKVDKKYWAVKHISLRVDKDANLNFVTDLKFEQTFEYNPMVKKWLIKRDQLITDFQLIESKDNFGFYAHRTIVYSNYGFEKNWNKSHIDSLKELGFRKKSLMYADIEETRAEKLTEKEAGIYEMIGKVEDSPEFKFVDNMVYILSNNHIPVFNKTIDIGPFWNLYSYNEIEGNRYFIGGKTAIGMSHNWHTQAFVAYGDRDKKWKYKIAGGVLVNRKKYHRLSFSKTKDYRVITETNPNNLLNSGTFISSIFSRGTAPNFMNIDEWKIDSEKDLNNSWRVTNELNRTNYEEVSEVLKFDFIPSGAPRDFSTTEAKIGLIYDINPRYVGNRTTQRWQLFVSNRLQVKFNGIFGFSNVLGSDYEYQKIELQTNYKKSFNHIGRLHLNIKGGILFGEVPYPLLFLAQGNRTFSLDFQKFSLIDNFELLSDRYVQIIAEQHFEGLVFNHIPLIRSLKLREVVGIKGILGNLNSKHKDYTINGNAINAPNDGGYWEASVGIENILKILRIDYVYRITHRNDENLSTDLQGFRFRFSFRL